MRSSKRFLEHGWGDYLLWWQDVRRESCGKCRFSVSALWRTLEDIVLESRESLESVEQ